MGPWTGQQSGWQGVEEGLGSWQVSQVEPRGLHMTSSCPQGFGALRRGYLGKWGHWRLWELYFKHLSSKPPLAAPKMNLGFPETAIGREKVGGTPSCRYHLPASLVVLLFTHWCCSELLHVVGLLSPHTHTHTHPGSPGGGSLEKGQVDSGQRLQSYPSSSCPQLQGAAMGREP